jgi:hypothetical protein
MVLTTHSMEEADALCSNIGIMIRGALRTVGSSQQLKARHGSGYRITIRVKDEGAAAAAGDGEQTQQRLFSRSTFLSRTVFVPKATKNIVLHMALQTLTKRTLSFVCFAFCVLRFCDSGGGSIQKLAEAISSAAVADDSAAGFRLQRLEVPMEGETSRREDKTREETLPPFLLSSRSSLPSSFFSAFAFFFHLSSLFFLVFFCLVLFFPRSQYVLSFSFSLMLCRCRRDDACAHLRYHPRHAGGAEDCRL